MSCRVLHGYMPLAHWLACDYVALSFKSIQFIGVKIISMENTKQNKTKNLSNYTSSIRTKYHSLNATHTMAVEFVRRFVAARVMWHKTLAIYVWLCHDTRKWFVHCVGTNAAAADDDDDDDDYNDENNWFRVIDSFEFYNLHLVNTIVIGRIFSNIGL